MDLWPPACPRCHHCKAQTRCVLRSLSVSVLMKILCSCGECSGDSALEVEGK